MDPDSPVLQELGRAYAERSPDGPGHFEAVARKGMQLISTEPSLTTSQISSIQQPVLVAVGDDDIVTLPHTISLYEALPNGQLAVIPGRPMACRSSSLPRSPALCSHSWQPKVLPGRSCPSGAARISRERQKVHWGTPETGVAQRTFFDCGQHR
ncbi:hypothetical protein ARTHRO8AJ_40032 [Arthrobacter sp. 8AJ]|nr:hypothetical protein ARTHRO8AJ_40032 [Arthrobacter sp. 8AJ]